MTNTERTMLEIYDSWQAEHRARVRASKKAVRRSNAQYAAKLDDFIAEIRADQALAVESQDCGSET